MQNPTYTLASRAISDRPDDYSGSQIHVIYAVPKGGVDRQLDLTSTIPFSLGAINRWLETQIGRKVRFDTYNGDLDIQFVQLPRTNAEYMATNDKFRQLRADITPVAPTGPKNLLVFYEGPGASAECGTSTMPQTTSGQQFSAVYLVGGGSPGCWLDTATSATAAATTYDSIPMHELFHGFGANHLPAFPTAPYPTEDYWKEECDLMFSYSNTTCTGRMYLDPFQRFYYSPTGFTDGRVNTYNSSFLTPAPAK